jgi:vacuolar iron transporter family protein
MSSDTPASVPLLRASAGAGLTRNKPPVWAIDPSGPSVQTPLLTECARHTREGGVCCQELKGEDERRLIDPDIIRDV